MKSWSVTPRILEVGAGLALLLVVCLTASGWLYYRSLTQALIAATYKSDAAAVRALLRRGANPNTRDEHRRPLVYYAGVRPSGATLKALLQAGADPEAIDSSGQTALIRAAQTGYLDVVQILVRFRADVNAQGGAGQTALIGATTNRHLEIVKELLRLGAAPGLKDRQGQTALSWARNHLRRDVSVIASPTPGAQRWAREDTQRRRRRATEILRVLEAAQPEPSPAR